MKVEIRKRKDEIEMKSQQIDSLEKHIASGILASHSTMDTSELSQVLCSFFKPLLASERPSELKAENPHTDPFINYVTVFR